MTSARTRTRTVRPNSSALTIRPSRRPLVHYLYHVYTYPMNKVHIGKVHHSTGNTPTHSYQLQARQLSFTFLQRRNSTFLLVYFTVALRSLGGDLNRTLILLFYCFKFNFTQTKRIGLYWNLCDQHKRKHKKDLIEVPVRSDLVSHSPWILWESSSACLQKQIDYKLIK